MVLFVFVVVGILAGVIGFPELLSIANLSMGEAVILLAIVVFTCTVFFKLATMMDSLEPRRRHAATGFGREVRALEGVEKAQPKKKKGTGVTRSRVTKSAQGIKVSMPSKKKKPANKA